MKVFFSIADFVLEKTPSETKIRFNKKLKIQSKSYDIFCYLKKNKRQIALTKNNDLGFLKKFNLPKIKEASKKNKNWKFLCKYKNSISNKKLNINLYYRFSSKIPSKYKWYSLKKNQEFIPSFTKKIFREILYLHKKFQFLFFLEVSLILGKLNSFRKPKSLFLVSAICFLFFFK